MRHWMVAALFVCPLVAAERTAVVERTFPAAQRLQVDNVWGPIEVTAHDRSDIAVHVQQRWTAPTEELLQQAEREVKLDITESAGTLRLYVDGPFRDHRDGGQRREYRAHFAFRIGVPRMIALDLQTVLDGDIRVTGTSGPFALTHVNGRVQAEDIAGSGTARTVNGAVRITFRENPPEACAFKTVNGEVALTFQPNLSADFRLKTLNGEAWTDFEYSRLGMTPVSGSRAGTLYRYRSSGVGLRVGTGGPEISIETLNGPIRIAKRGQQ